MPKVKFVKNAPCGFMGYGKDVYDMTDKQLEVFQKSNVNYEIEIIEEPKPVKKTTKKSKKVKSDD